MPGIVRTFADINPVSLTVDTTRALTIGDAHALGPTLGALTWLAGLLHRRGAADAFRTPKPKISGPGPARGTARCRLRAGARWWRPS
jgi:hypothetical protein